MIMATGRIVTSAILIGVYAFTFYALFKNRKKIAWIIANPAKALEELINE